MQSNLTKQQIARLEELFQKSPKRLKETVQLVNDGQRVPCKTKQRPTFFLYPELTAQTWFDSSKFPWTQMLEKNVDVIRKEFLNVYNSKVTFDKIRSSIEGGDWTIFPFYNQGNKIEKHFKLCPATASLLEKVPIMTGVAFTYVYFSVVTPGTHITPHTGVCNIRLRYQLPLIVPKGNCVSLRVGDETRIYQEGKSFVFDDTFVHEVKHCGKEGIRVVLLIDFWHPDLTEYEKEAIQMLLPPPPLD